MILPAMILPPFSSGIGDARPARVNTPKSLIHKLLQNSAFFRVSPLTKLAHLLNFSS